MHRLNSSSFCPPQTREHIAASDSHEVIHESDEGLRDEDSQTAERIEKFALNILRQIVRLMVKSEHPVTTRSTSGGSRRQTKTLEISVASRRKGGNARRVLRYPVGSRASSSKQIAQLLKIMDYAHQAVKEGVSATKRDLYYRDPTLFKSQRTVDLLVDDLAATLKQERADLNIRATSKGLICGSSMNIRLVEGETLQLGDSEGTLIPPGEDIGQFEVKERVAWVLIVEKDAIFQTLCQLQLCKNPVLPGPGLIVTDTLTLQPASWSKHSLTICLTTSPSLLWLMRTRMALIYCQFISMAVKDFSMKVESLQLVVSSGLELNPLNYLSSILTLICQHLSHSMMRKRPWQCCADRRKICRWSGGKLLCMA